LPVPRAFGPSRRPRQASPIDTAAGTVAHHPRFRTVEDGTGLKLFIGVRISAPSPEALLSVVETLADWVRAAKRDAEEARNSGQWDLVHEVELVVGERMRRMSAADFAQYVYELSFQHSDAPAKPAT
jgi:hypothetical protein